MVAVIIGVDPHKASHTAVVSSAADLAMRSFAAFLAETSPQTVSLRAVTRPPRRGLQAMAGRPPRAEQARLTTATIAHRLGTLRMFFARIAEWGWGRSPAPGADVPRRPAPPGPPLPKALDHATAANCLRAAQATRYPRTKMLR
jgi:hypothetical protein